MALTIYIEAEYDDGYIHREDEQDHSPYESGRNIFYDILHKLPEKPHGPMVRFSLITPEQRWDIDWTVLPANARPIRFMKKERDYEVGTNEPVGEIRMTGIDFGYQYLDDAGENQQEVLTVEFG